MRPSPICRWSVPIIAWASLAFLSPFATSADNATHCCEGSEAYRTHNMALPIIHFASDSAELDSQFLANLNKLIQRLAEDSHIQLAVIGHTDNVGSVGYNQRLAERRARVFVRYLVNSGVTRERLDLQTASERRPMVSNSDECGRANNRRVVFAEK